MGVTSKGQLLFFLGGGEREVQEDNNGRGDRSTIEVNHRTNSFKSSAKALLTSDRGLIHRSKRPIEPESCFGNIKFNHGFKRFHLKSTRKTKVEWGLVSLDSCRKALPERGRPRPRERLPKERSSKGWMKRSGTLAEPSDNSSSPYRIQETDPFGSASFCVLCRGTNIFPRFFFTISFRPVRKVQTFRPSQD